MDSKKGVFLVSFIFGIKLLLAAFVPVFGDEAYYYVWSQHLQLSYFDHPGMVSWLIYLSHLFLPAGHAFSLRFSFVLLSFLTSFIWLQILKIKNFNSTQTLLFFALLFLNPLLGIGSILATPDVALVFFWSLSYYCFINILRTHKIFWYVLLGSSLGLGFCSKYHIVIFVLSGLIYLLLSRNLKKIKLTGALLTVTFGTLFSLPVLIWNAQNSWSSFLFQIHHGFGESNFEWTWPLGYLLAQTLIINPFVLVTLFTRQPNSSERVYSISQLVFFFTSSFKSVVEGNWPLTSHLHSITHACQVLNRKYIMATLAFWIFFYAALSGFFISDLSLKVRKNLVNTAQLNEVFNLTESYAPLYGASYQIASLISWKTQKSVPKLNELSRHDFFDSLPESIPQEKVFYALKYDYSNWPEKYNHYKKFKLQSFDNVGLELYQFKHE